jgi:hypothetical protein
MRFLIRVHVAEFGTPYFYIEVTQNARTRKEGSMKNLNLRWYVSISLMLTFCATVVKGFTIDGTNAAEYGSAIVTQKLATTASDNTLGAQGAGNGSELDAAYGVISGGTLHLFLAGNLSSSLAQQFDKLSIFFMTGPGGDHTLGTNYNGNADFGHINRMGTDGGSLTTGGAGLTFDTGFAANYWIGVTVDTNASSTFYVNYEVICSNCNGAFLGSATPTNTMVDGAFGVQAAFNNSNTNGVPGDPAGCTTNTAQGNVTTGVELAIPLSAIGNPTGKVSICAFITDEFYDTLYNQVLGPVTDGTTTYCQVSLGESSQVDFSTLPGTNSFTITVPQCEVFLLSPTSASYSTNGGSGSVSLTMVGNCSWSVTSSVPWVTITSSTSGLGNSTINYSVGTNATVNPRSGALTVSGGDGVTATLTISQDGIFLPPLSTIIVDGIAESAYGCPIAVQRLQTQFGDSVGTNLMSNPGGSELDAAYGLIKDNVLFLVFAGNLENNNNRLDIFFMTGPGGRNSLTNLQVSVNSNTNKAWDSNNGLNNMASTTNAPNPGPGLTFDPGFNPNYIISVNGGIVGVYQFFVNYAQLWPGGTNSLGVATNGYFVGSTTTTNGTLALGADGLNPFGIQATINDSNTNGVDGGSCVTNGIGVVETTLAASVRTGIELGIPLGALGSPTGAIAICAFINSGDHTFPSNQILGPMGTNDPTVVSCQVNLGGVTNIANVNLGNFSGGPHFFQVGPEMRVTGITVVTNTTVKVTYQTEANTNLTYVVQRTTSNLTVALTNNAMWTTISSAAFGNGGTITVTDPQRASVTNTFYRVRQTPLCP